jgi:hypothetical protein
MSTNPKSDDLRDDRTEVTGEVGAEGGGDGDVEVGTEQAPATGSEADETWRPTERNTDTIVRDDTGVGRRSP